MLTWRHAIILHLLILPFVACEIGTIHQAMIALKNEHNSVILYSHEIARHRFLQYSVADIVIVMWWCDVPTMRSVL